MTKQEAHIEFLRNLLDSRTALVEEYRKRVEKAESESSRLKVELANAGAYNTRLEDECEGLRVLCGDALANWLYLQEAMHGVGDPSAERWDWRGNEPFQDWLFDRIAALSRQEPAPKPETGTELVKPLEVAPPFDPSYIEYYKKKAEPEAAPDILRIAKNAGEALAEASRSENPMPEAEREVIEAAKEYPTEEMGIHPASVKGTPNGIDDYEQRTPEMEEHNRKCTRLVVALARLAAASKPADTKNK